MGSLFYRLYQILKEIKKVSMFDKNRGKEFDN